MNGGQGIQGNMTSGLCDVSGVRNVEVGIVRGGFTPRVVGDVGERFNVRFNVRVEVVSDYLYIGSGMGLPELVVNRDNRTRSDREIDFVYLFSNQGPGRLVIPGSTIKGAIRSRLELLSRCNNNQCKAVGNFTVTEEQRPPWRSIRNVPRHYRNHVLVWCESIFEDRSQPQGAYSVVEDLFGAPSIVYRARGRRRVRDAVASRVLFSDLPLVSDVDPVIAEVEAPCPEEMGREVETKRLQLVPKGGMFEGEVILLNANIVDLGLVLLGLGQEKPLCRLGPRILLGMFKYVRPKVNGVPKLFGIVRVDVGGFAPDRITSGAWEGVFGGVDDSMIIRKAVEAALDYAREELGDPLPRPPNCFDEVSRRLQLPLDPCEVNRLGG